MKLSPDAIESAAAIIRERTGLIFGDGRRSALVEALHKSVRRSKAADASTFLVLLGSEPELTDELVAELTVGETYFFREPQQLDVIREQVLPDLLSRRPRAGGRSLRVWSAGCATGEEAYTLAIVLREKGLAGQTTILGTDLSRVALAKARRARYTRWSLRGIEGNVSSRYFEQVDNRFELLPVLRSAVDFGYLNLAQDSYPSLSNGIWGMDLIVCRNVLIYFDPETVARVAARLIDSLSDGGWLVLGSSDPIISELAPCDVVITKGGLAYRRRGKASSSTAPISAPAPIPRIESPAPVSDPVDVPVVAERPQAVRSPGEAARMYAAGDYAGAAEMANQVIRTAGSEASISILLVRSHANRGDLAEASRACAEGMERHPENAELSYLHAVLLTQSGQYAVAAKAARAALYLDRELVVAHVLLGATLLRLGDRDGSRRSYVNAQRLLDSLSPEATIPASDGEPARRMAEMVRVHLYLLDEAAA